LNRDTLRKHACVLAARDGNNERTALSLNAWCDALVKHHAMDLLRATLDLPVSSLPPHLHVSECCGSGLAIRFPASGRGSGPSRPQGRR
jgi:hypothetical protein